MVRDILKRKKFGNNKLINMKTQIRRNVFETNSSNEHSLTVMNSDMFRRWKNGELLARVKSSKEDPNCSGNFWSRMYFLEFTYGFEKAKEDNFEILNRVKSNHIERLEEWKRNCLNHVKLVKEKLTSEELENLSDEDRDKYEDNLYMDEIHEFDKEEYDYLEPIYKNLNIDNFSEHFSKIEEGMWISYDEFISEWKEECYSLFEHEDSDNGVYIIGKYFHS